MALEISIEPEIQVEILDEHARSLFWGQLAVEIIFQRFGLRCREPWQNRIRRGALQPQLKTRHDETIDINDADADFEL